MKDDIIASITQVILFWLVSDKLLLVEFIKCVDFQRQTPHTLKFEKIAIFSIFWPTFEIFNKKGKILTATSLIIFNPCISPLGSCIFQKKSYNRIIV